MNLLLRPKTLSQNTFRFITVINELFPNYLKPKLENGQFE